METQTIVDNLLHRYRTAYWLKLTSGVLFTLAFLFTWGYCAFAIGKLIHLDDLANVNLFQVSGHSILIKQLMNKIIMNMLSFTVFTILLLIWFLFATHQLRKVRYAVLLSLRKDTIGQKYTDSEKHELKVARLAKESKWRPYLYRDTYDGCMKMESIIDFNEVPEDATWDYTSPYYLKVRGDNRFDLSDPTEFRFDKIKKTGTLSGPSKKGSSKLGGKRYVQK